MADGGSHVGVAPVFYFWGPDDHRLGLSDPAGDVEIAGKIAARLLGRDEGVAVISIPDGSVLRVAAGAITRRPSEVVINVPVGP